MATEITKRGAILRSVFYCDVIIFNDFQKKEHVNATKEQRPLNKNTNRNVDVYYGFFNHFFLKLSINLGGYWPETSSSRCLLVS